MNNEESENPTIKRARIINDEENNSQDEDMDNEDRKETPFNNPPPVNPTQQQGSNQQRPPFNTTQQTPPVQIPGEFAPITIMKVKDMTMEMLNTFKKGFESNQTLVKAWIQKYELVDPALLVDDANITATSKNKIEESERLLKALPTESTVAKLVKIYNELVAAVYDDMAMVFVHLQKLEQLLNLVESDANKIPALTTPQLKVNLKLLLPSSPIFALINKVNVIIYNLNVFINTAKTTQFLVYMVNGVKLKLKPPRKDYGQFNGLYVRREKLTQQLKANLLAAINVQLGVETPTNNAT